MNPEFFLNFLNLKGARSENCLDIIGESQDRSSVSPKSSAAAKGIVFMLVGDRLSAAGLERAASRASESFGIFENSSKERAKDPA